MRPLFHKFVNYLKTPFGAFCLVIVGLCLFVVVLRVSVSCFTYSTNDQAETEAEELD